MYEMRRKKRKDRERKKKEQAEEAIKAKRHKTMFALGGSILLAGLVGLIVYK